MHSTGSVLTYLLFLTAVEILYKLSLLWSILVIGILLLTELQIRGSTEDNSKIIFLISQ